MSVIPWIGSHRIAIVPVFNRQVDREPPADWENQVRSRVFYDSDPATGLDRSFQHYLQALSYGQAFLEGEILPAVWSEDATVNIPAIESLPAGHGYTELLAILPHEAGEHRGGHAFRGAPVNGISGWARVAMFTLPFMNTRQSVGVWAQELIHLLGNMWDHTGLDGYDVMNGDGARRGTHACANTKSLMGWLPAGVLDHVDGALRVGLHAIGQMQPPPPGRVTAVRVASQLSANRFIVEGRAATDQFDQMVPKQGVLVYEIEDTPGGQKVDLRSAGALSKGQTFDNPDEGLQVTVDDTLAGGFAVTVRKTMRRLVDRSAQFGTPPAAGAPTACVIPGLGVHNIAYRDTSGRLHELWRDAQGVTGTTNLTANVGAQTPTATGNPFAYVDTSRNTEILLFRGGDGTVRSLYWSTGPVGHDNLSGTAGASKAAGDPVGYYAAAADTHHVIYRTGDGHLHELNWTGVAPVVYGGNLTGAISAPRAAGQPSAFVNAAGVNIVVYRGVNSRIFGLYWAEGPSGLDDLSGVAGTPPAAGDPFAYYTAHDDTHQIVYLGNDGHLWELYWPGVAPVVGWDLTAPSGAPAAAGAPVAYYSAGTNTKHVIYRSADGRLHEIWWVPGGGTPAHVDLTAFAGAPPAADRPAAFTVEGPNSQHVAYRGTDNHIYEVRW